MELQVLCRLCYLLKDVVAKALNIDTYGKENQNET